MDLSKPSTTMTPGVLVMPIEVCCAVILEFSQSFIASRFKLTVDFFGIFASCSFVALSFWLNLSV